jgi:hypothetical protein
LQSHVSHLRSVLGSKAAILAKPPGYVLDLGDEGTDAQLAERLLRQATRSPDPVQGVSWLREALAMWRGRPLAEARLASGEHAELVPDLERMVADHPLDDPRRRARARTGLLNEALHT